jgi:KDO2-lipid IV(A) lauroyltransferase
VEYLLARGLAATVNTLPIGVSTWLARRAGDLIFLLFQERRKIALENLTLAYGDSLSLEEKERIARESIRNFATSLMEFFRIPSLLTRAQSSFQFEGTEILDRAFTKGKGIIFVISHLGSWELLAFLPYLRGYPCSVIVREIRNPYINRWIQALRAKTRLNPIPKEQSIRETLSRLKENQLVAILIDQWGGNEGLAVDFFDKPTSTTSIPERLAEKTGAALVPGYCLRLAPGQYKIIIKAEVPVESSRDPEGVTTSKLNELLEQEVLAHPEQWAWVHRRWKDS